MSDTLKIRLLNTLLTLLFLSLICWGVTSQTRLLKCESKSLEGIHYLFVVKINSYKRGDIVFIQDHKTSYKGEKPLAKRILGLPGDNIVKGRNTVKIEPTSIGAQNSISLPLLKKTKKGEALTPITTMIIPEGYVFVAGDHPRSFDSRYEEFGLVPMDKIWGKALLVW